ncbi:MAG: universal stress protein [Candidatus Hydrothermarchaeota archaeon]
MIFEKILLTTDGSPACELAAIRGIEIAKIYNSKVFIMNVVSNMEKYQKFAEENVKRVKEMAEKMGVKAETIIKEGKVADTIVDTAKDLGISLIVVPTHTKGLKQAILGGVTERIIRKAPEDIAVMIWQMKES